MPTPPWNPVSDRDGLQEFPGGRLELPGQRALAEQKGSSAPLEALGVVPVLTPWEAHKEGGHVSWGL